MATMAPTGTLPAGNPRVRKNPPPEPAAKILQEADGKSMDRKRKKSPPSADPPEPAKGKPALSAKILPEADGQSLERKRKILPSADPQAETTDRKKKKKEKTISPAAETKKTPLPLGHAWTPGDEVRIVEAMAAHRQGEQDGKLPRSKELFASLDGRLDNKGFTLKELRRKVRSLKRRHDDDAIKDGVPAEEHECRLYHLSKNVWGTIFPEPVATARLGEPAAPMHIAVDEPAVMHIAVDEPAARKTFDEMSELYPWLAHEVEHFLDEPAVLERLLLGIDDSKARALNSKINDLRQELTDGITESANMQNIQVPKGWQCPYNKAQLEKSRAANLHLVHKIDGLRDAAQEKLARMDRGLVKLKQGIIASWPSSPKAESAESAPRSVVAEKQLSHNVKQRKILVQEKSGHGNNKEVTSKHRPPQNLSRKMMFAPKRTRHARKEKMEDESQILHEADQRKVDGRAQLGLSHDRNVEGGKQVILHSYVRPHKPVAKATLQKCSPSTIVGGKALGPGCCEVLINEVLDGKAPLIRPFGNMNTMADTLGFSIAWIRENIRHDTTAGIVAPIQPSPEIRVSFINRDGGSTLC